MGRWRVSVPLPPTGKPVPLICSADQSGGCSGYSPSPRGRPGTARCRDETQGTQLALLALVLAAGCDLGEGCGAARGGSAWGVGGMEGEEESREAEEMWCAKGEVGVGWARHGGALGQTGRLRPGPG